MTYEAWRISYQSSEQAARAAYAECARLQAKIEAMEKQEPYSYIYRYADPLDGSPIWRHDSRAWNGQIPGACKPLYALPGAQPELNLSDPDVQKQLAAQWGYVQKPHPDCDSGCMFQCAQPAPSVPDGWKLVPIVSTHEMKEAGVCAGAAYYAIAKDVWSAMLTAAPEVQP